MSKTNAFETSYSTLIFTNVNLAGIGDATGLLADAVAGNLYVALYTSDPTDAASGTECAYGSYARVAVARSGVGWTVSGNNTSNAATVQFITCTGGTEVATHVAIHASLFSGSMLYHGALDSSLNISTGVAPKFLAGELDINED